MFIRVLTMPVLLMFIIALSACMSVPVTNIPKLLALKPETMDIAGMEVAVRVQEEMRVYKDGVKLKFEAPRAASDEVMKEQFVLIPVEENLPPYLQAQLKKGFYIKRFRVARPDVERFNLYREQVLAEREIGIGKKKSSFFATANGCFSRGANPFKDVRMTLYLKTAEDAKFFKILHEQKLQVVSNKNENAGLKYCDDADQARL